MLSVSPRVQIFLCLEPADMRQSFDTLAEMVRTQVGGDPLSGHLFVFRSKRGDRLKVLYWDGDGLVLWYKRLEEGSFLFPKVPAGREGQGLEVRASDLAMLLDGVDLTGVKRTKRYRRPAFENAEG